MVPDHAAQDAHDSRVTRLEGVLVAAVAWQVALQTRDGTPARRRGNCTLDRCCVLVAALASYDGFHCCRRCRRDRDEPGVEQLQQSETAQPGASLSQMKDRRRSRIPVGVSLRGERCLRKHT